jgi:hypothetical protein
LTPTNTKTHASPNESPPFSARDRRCAPPGLRGVHDAARPRLTAPIRHDCARFGHPVLSERVCKPSGLGPPNYPHGPPAPGLPNDAAAARFSSTTASASSVETRRPERATHRPALTRRLAHDAGRPATPA